MDPFPAINFSGIPIPKAIAMYRNQGPIFPVEIDGAQWVALAGPEANTFCWGNPDFWSYGDAMQGFTEELGPTHLTQLDRAPHRRKRRLLNPGFSLPAVMRRIPQMAQVIESWLPRAEGGPFELHEFLMTLLTDVQSRASLSVELSDERLHQLVRFEEEFITAALMERERRHRYYSRAGYQELKSDVLNFLGGIVDDRLAGLRNGDGLSDILDAAEGARFEPPTREELIFDAYLLLIAGSGNTAKIICRALYHIFENPDWLEKLRNELAGFSGDSLAAGMSAFPLLKATILEAERMYPAAPVLPRVAFQDITFAGQTIPAGTRVLHLHTLTHYLDEFYEDPFTWNPARWLSLDVSKDRRAQHGAFGGGSHICLGMNLARVHAPLVIGYFVKNFTLRCDEPPSSRIVVPEAPDSPFTLKFDVSLARNI
ncbi:MAG TPA: cytochrome P450 [Chthoniobacterales bacterium]